MRRIRISKATLLPLLLGIIGAAQAQVEPTAGQWKTWVLTSGAQLRLPPPPGKGDTARELNSLLALQTRRDDAAIQRIEHWNAGAPGYRWHQLFQNLETSVPVGYLRDVALLDVAVYDATVAAWDSKYAHRRPRPSAGGSGLKPHLPTPDSPSYPCEHAVTAGAASVVLAYLFPAKADSIRQLALEAGESRLLAGVAYPSDVKAGFELGQKIGELVVARAKADGSDARWAGTLPTEAGRWQGKDPMAPGRGRWKTWVLTSGDQFRPGPPPDFTQEMAELKAAKRSFPANARAYYWATRFMMDEVTDRLLFEYNLTANPPRAARIRALASVANEDAGIACWDAKYAYWGIRPFQYDSTYKPLIFTPNFPGYPSGHATLSGATATVLGYLFPAEAGRLQKMAQECAQSRFDGGIHFKTDNDVGLDLGRKVGEEVVKWAGRDGAQK